MGEYVPTRIKFGGRLPAPKVPELIELLDQYHFYSNHNPQDALTSDCLLDQLVADEVNYGQIENVLDFCKREGLDYEHWIDACAGQDPTITRYVGGEVEALDYADGNPVIPLSRLLTIETLVTGMADILALAKRWNKPLELEIVP